MASKDPEPGSGIRSTRTTGVFRAVNFELFAKPVRSQFVWEIIGCLFQDRVRLPDLSFPSCGLSPPSHGYVMNQKEGRSSRTEPVPCRVLLISNFADTSDSNV